MFLTENDKAKAIAEWKQDGIDEANRRVATTMLKKHLPLDIIIEVSELSEEAIRKIAKEVNTVISPSNSEKQALRDSDLFGYLTEYDEERAIAEWRQDGIDETRQRVAADMLKDNLPLTVIVRISKLSEEAIRKIAKEINVNVVL